MDVQHFNIFLVSVTTILVFNDWSKIRDVMKLKQGTQHTGCTKISEKVEIVSQWHRQDLTLDQVEQRAARNSAPTAQCQTQRCKYHLSTYVRNYGASFYTPEVHHKCLWHSSSLICTYTGPSCSSVSPSFLLHVNKTFKKCIVQQGPTKMWNHLVPSSFDLFCMPVCQIQQQFWRHHP